MRCEDSTIMTICEKWLRGRFTTLQEQLEKLNFSEIRSDLELKRAHKVHGNCAIHSHRWQILLAATPSGRISAPHSIPPSTVIPTQPKWRTLGGSFLVYGNKL